MEPYQAGLFAVVLLGGAGIGYLVRRVVVSQQAHSIEDKLKGALSEAEEKAKKIILEAEGKAINLLSEAKKEERERKAEISNSENRVLRREEVLEKKASTLSVEEAALKTKSENLKKQEEKILSTY